MKTGALNTLRDLFRTLSLLSVVTGMILLHARQCSAQGTFAYYTSRAAFDAAVSSSTTVTFESLQPSDPNSVGVPLINVSGLTFSDSPAARLFITSPTTGLYPIQGAGQYLWNFDPSSPVSVSLPTGRNAFAADLSGGRPGNNPFSGTLTFNLAGGGIYNYDFVGQVGSWTFLGFAFQQEIRSLVFSDGGGITHDEMLDNVSFGIIAVPEPGTSALAALGLFLAGLRIRKTRRS